MRAKSLRILIPMLAVAVAAVAVACGGGTGYDGASNPTPSSSGHAAAPPAVSSTTAAKNAAGGAGHVVKAVEGAGDPTTAWKFEPAEITVKVGGSVTFQNSGTQQHTATANDGSFDTGALAAGATKLVTFSRAGTFTFHCSFHPWMTGTVTVTSADVSASGASGGAPAAGVASGGGGFGY